MLLPIKDDKRVKVGRSYIGWSQKKENRVLMLQSQDLRVGQVKEPCIGLTQENLIENSIQDYLPYILISNSPCELFLAYSK